MEGKKMDPALIAAGIAVTVTVVGAILVFWSETETDQGAIDERVIWVEKWLSAKDKRVEDTVRRVERLESLKMKGSE